MGVKRRLEGCSEEEIFGAILKKEEELGRPGGVRVGGGCPMPRKQPEKPVLILKTTLEIGHSHFHFIDGKTKAQM